MEKDPAMWSRQFARKIAEIMGFSKIEKESDDAATRKEAESLVGELTEDFRYLPLEQWNWVDHLARFLVACECEPRQVSEAPAVPAALAQQLAPSVDKLREVRLYVAFLRSRYGSDQPADESDEWTEEDERDFALQSWRRLEEEDPWPEDDFYRPKEEGGDDQAG